MFKTFKAETFIKKYKLDRRFYDDVRTLLDMYAIHNPKNAVPSIQGGYWRRWLDKEPYETLKGDIDCYMSHFPMQTEFPNMVPFIKFLCDQYSNDKISSKIDFNDINTEKNITVNVHHLKDTPIKFQCMGRYFHIYNNKKVENPYIDGVKLSLSKMDSYINMIGYDFYSDKFIIHDYAYPSIKKKHYYINGDGQINPNNIIKRIAKFSYEGYTLTDKDFQVALNLVKNAKNSDIYDANATDITDQNCLNNTINEF